MLKKYIFLILISMGLLSPAHADFMLYTQAQINNLKDRPSAWEPLKAMCDVDITKTPAPAISYDPAPYYDDPDYNPKREALKNDTQAIWRMGLCYRLTNTSIYAEKAQWFINEWAHTLVDIPTDQGKSDMAFYMPYLVLGADLVDGYNNFDPNDYVKNWLRWTIAPTSKSATGTNNIAAWGVLLDTTIAVYRNDQTAKNNARLRWKSIVTAQVAPNGTLPAEICRSDTSDYCGGATKGIKGIGYSHFWMIPMTQTAQIHENLGSTMFQSTEGLKFKTAYEKAIGYVMNRPSFEYFDEITALDKPLASIDNTGYVRTLMRAYPSNLATAILAEGKSYYDPFFSILVYSRRWTNQ